MISILVSTYGSDEWSDTGLYAAQHTALFTEAPCYSHHEPDGTIATSRNASAGLAKTDWLCFLDADDELDPLFVPWMEKSIERYPDWLNLHTPAVRQVRNGRPMKEMFFPEVDLQQANWLIIGTVISKRLFQKVGGFREHPHGLEDWNLWKRCDSAGAQVIKVKRAVYIAHYNHHSKHHEIRRDRKTYQAAYEAARADV